MNSEKEVKINNIIFLLGYMGTGKTTVSRLLAEKLDLPMIDLDAEIVEEQGVSINDIFATHGEEYFRELETQRLKILDEGTPAVVSCGGGLPLKSENRALLKEKGISVLLTAKAETIYERVKNDDQRPLLKDNMSIEFIASMLEKRQPAYEQAAQLVIGTDGKKPEEICQEIYVGIFDRY